MSSLVFRPAQRADVPQIVQLLADDVRGHGREDASLPLDTRYLAAFDAIEASAGNQLIVGDNAGVIVACAQLTIIPSLSYFGGTRAIIEGVRVAGAHRSQGIGEALMAHLVSLARAARCHTALLTTNKTRHDAHRFYARIGFENSHEGFKLTLQAESRRTDAVPVPTHIHD